MDGSAHLDEQLDGGGEGGSPFLTLDGFAGPLDHLLTLARAQKIDLSRIALGALVDQLVVALRQASANMPLGQKADWVVMAAWLVQLRTRRASRRPRRRRMSSGSVSSRWRRCRRSHRDDQSPARRPKRCVSPVR